MIFDFSAGPRFPKDSGDWDDFNGSVPPARAAAMSALPYVPRRIKTADVPAHALRIPGSLRQPPPAVLALSIARTLKVTYDLTGVGVPLTGEATQFGMDDLPEDGGMAATLDERADNVFAFSDGDTIEDDPPFYRSASLVLTLGGYGRADYDWEAREWILDVQIGLLWARLDDDGLAQQAVGRGATYSGAVYEGVEAKFLGVPAPLRKDPFADDDLGLAGEVKIGFGTGFRR
jgi:hypothetical protein